MASLSPAAETVIEMIQEMVRCGKVVPGGRFPAERVLAERIGVSRNNVREALRYLELVGIVSIKRGSGAFLEEDSETLYKVFNAKQILENYSMSEMFQARRVIEIGIVRYAALNAGRDDKIKLRNAMQRVELTCENAKTDAGLKDHIQADYEFHREIAKATHNSILLELHATIKDVIRISVEIWKTVPEFSGSGVLDHRLIVDAIENNDPVAAMESMEKHLRHMELLYYKSEKTANSYNQHT